MSLRLRRGTDAERASIVFAEGEVVYTTDTKLVYVGDGATPGGVNLVANASSVAPNSITIEKLAVSDGTAGQVLSTDGNGTLSFIDSIGLSANSVGVNELDVTPGTDGQVLGLNLQGELVFADVVVPAKSVSVEQINANPGSEGQVLSIDAQGGFVFADVLATVPEDSVGVLELEVQPGTAGQILSIDGSGNLAFIDALTSVPDDSIGVDQINANPGLEGDLLSIDAQGGLVFIDPILAIPDNSIDISKLDVADGTPGQVLTTDGFGALSFTSIPGVSGNINVDNITALSVTASSFDGDLKGSVFGDDSSIIIDSNNRTVYADTLLSSRSDGDLTNPVYVGDTTAPSGLRIFTDTNNSIIIHGLVNTGEAANIRQYSSRGTFTQPQSVQIGDQLAGQLGLAWNGTSYDPCGGMAIFASDIQDNEVHGGAGFVIPKPGTGATQFWEYVFDATGTFTSNTVKATSDMQIPSYADAAARDAAITAPSTGSMVLLLDNGAGDTVTTIYDGTSWRSLAWV